MQYAALARADIASDQEAGRAEIANKERRGLGVDMLCVKRDGETSRRALVLVHGSSIESRRPIAKAPSPVPFQVDPGELVPIVPKVEHPRARNGREAIDARLVEAGACDLIVQT